MKKILATVVSILVCVLLFGCSGGIQGDEAKAHIRGFFKEVEEGDFETAETYLHPDRPAQLKDFFQEMEQDAGVDFSEIEIDDYTGVSFSYYESTVDGSRYALSMELDLKEGEAKAEIELVRNDNGFGIYQFTVTPARR